MTPRRFTPPRFRRRRTQRRSTAVHFAAVLRVRRNLWALASRLRWVLLAELADCSRPIRHRSRRVRWLEHRLFTGAQRLTTPALRSTHVLLRMVTDRQTARIGSRLFGKAWDEALGGDSRNVIALAAAKLAELANVVAPQLEDKGGA